MNKSTDRYVVQVLSNVDGWQNTRYSSNWLGEAQREARKLCLRPGAFIGGKITPVRIMDRKTNISSE
jgi:hypothetical protein